MSAIYPTGTFPDIMYPQVTANTVTEVGAATERQAQEKPLVPGSWSWSVTYTRLQLVGGEPELVPVEILDTYANSTHPHPNTTWMVTLGTDSLFITGGLGYQVYTSNLPDDRGGPLRFRVTYNYPDPADLNTLIIVETQVWVTCNLTVDKMVASVAEVDKNNFSVSGTATVRNGNPPYAYTWSYEAFYATGGINQPYKACPSVLVSGGGKGDASITVQAAKRFQDAAGHYQPVYIVIGCGVTDAGRCYADTGLLAGTWKTPSPSSGSTYTQKRTLIIPLMDTDTVTGRLYLATGAVDYSADYASLIASDTGAASLQPPAYTHQSSHPIYLATSEAGNAPCPFVRGHDIGATPSNPANILLPDALVVLAQQGLVRIGLRESDHAYTGLPLLGRAYRESRDLGQTWTDSTDTWPGSSAVGSPSRTHALLAGAGRAQRTLALPAAEEPVPGPEASGGASGYTYTQNSLLAQLRLPLWRTRDNPAPFARSSPYPHSNPGGVPPNTRRSQDGGKTAVADAAAPSLGDTPGAANLPGYPFAGDWAGYGPEAQFIFGISLGAAVSLPPVSPVGGLVWARGPGENTAIWLFCPGLMRLPILRDSFPPAAGSTDPEAGFKQYSDAPDTTHGLDWGHHTTICYALTTDGGRSYGDLYVVMVGGSALIVPTETVRIAACRGAGGRVWLCVAAAGLLSLYMSDNPADQNWTLAGTSENFGATWNKAA